MKNDIAALVRDTLVEAGSTFREDKKEAYRKAIDRESNEKAKWVLETVLANAEAAEKNRSPLCDDTGIPHLVLEVGPDCAVTGHMLDEIRQKYDLSILFSTHDFSTLRHYADKVILLQQTILRQGSPKDVLGSPEFQSVFHLNLEEGGAAE